MTLRYIQKFQKGLITKNELSQQLGPKKMREIEHHLGSTHNNSFTNIAKKVLYDDINRKDKCVNLTNFDPKEREYNFNSNQFRKLSVNFSWFKDQSHNKRIIQFSIRRRKWLGWNRFIPIQNSKENRTNGCKR